MHKQRQLFSDLKTPALIVSLSLFHLLCPSAPFFFPLPSLRANYPQFSALPRSPSSPLFLSSSSSRPGTSSPRDQRRRGAAAAAGLGH